MKFDRDLMASIATAGRASIDNICQFKPVRAVLGGSWVKLDGRWVQVNILLIAQDGSRFFRLDTPGAQVSFHETYFGVSAVESYT